MTSPDTPHRDALQKAFGDNLRRWRESLDLTQEAAATRTGINPTTYQKIENGHRMPRLENIVKLIRGLEADPCTLFDGLPDLLPSPDEWAPAGRRRQLPQRRRTP